MRKVLLVTLACVAVLALFWASVDAQQRRYTIRPRYHDFDPYDGILDKGTRLNPYEIYDNSGRRLGTIQPRFYDFDPYDGFMDPGTYTNPYELKWGD